MFPGRPVLIVTSSDKTLLRGFAVILALVCTGIFTGAVLPVAGAAVFLLVSVMVMGYPPKMAVLLFTVQVVFTTTFLLGFSIYAGPVRLTIDDFLQIWVFMLWMGALVDGDGKVQSSPSGKLIMLMIIISVAAFLHGLFRGYDAAVALIFLKSILGYLFFFPAMWILGNRSNLKLLSGTLIAVSVVAALWVLLKGFTGGEGVYVRATSGLRVTSQELNVVMVGLFLVAFILWKKHGSLPVAAGVASMVVMGASLLLGQSRALWLAVAAGVLCAFTADLGRTGMKGIKPGPLLSRVLLLAVFTAGSIAFVSAAGLLNPQDVAARGAGADGGLTGDVSLMARFLSWWEITVTVTASPLTLFFGTGFGHYITYYRPDLYSVVSVPYVDGSFFQLLLNTGLTGVVILALLYARGITESFRQVLTSETQEEVITAMWLNASFTALTIAALSSSLITNYRFSCIWGFLFAVLETQRTGKQKKRLKETLN